jgi:F0F1-type ATP synthase membrane subunit b/b'
MTSEKVSTSVASIEKEAENILESAKKQAGEIILKAKDEAKSIISCKPPVDEFKKESASIVHKATESADKKFRDAENEYARIMKLAEPRINDISKRILNIVTGVISK